MNTIDALRNAIYEIKFSQLPGTHENGKKRKVLTVDQALNRLAYRMGISPIKVRPLYEVNWGNYDLYSSVSGAHYEIVPEKDSERVILKYEGTWVHHANLDDAIDYLAAKERGVYGP